MARCRGFFPAAEMMGSTNRLEAMPGRGHESPPRRDGSHIRHHHLLTGECSRARLIHAGPIAIPSKIRAWDAGRLGPAPWRKWASSSSSNRTGAQDAVGQTLDHRANFCQHRRQRSIRPHHLQDAGFRGEHLLTFFALGDVSPDTGDTR